MFLGIGDKNESCAHFVGTSARTSRCFADQILLLVFHQKHLVDLCLRWEQRRYSILLLLTAEPFASLCVDCATASVPSLPEDVRCIFLRRCIADYDQG